MSSASDSRHPYRESAVLWTHGISIHEQQRIAKVYGVAIRVKLMLTVVIDPTDEMRDRIIEIGFLHGEPSHD
jgi:hypothetical protein